MRRRSLWLYFVGIVFVTMLVSAVVVAFIAMQLLHEGSFAPGVNPFPHVFQVLVFMSVLIGASVTIFVGRAILSPIIKFGEATQEVAKGNFSVRIEENHKITEIYEMSRRFNNMIQELGSIETLRNDFVVNVSHEFKTPIAAIEGYATLLLENNLAPAEHEEYVKMILESARQLSSLSGNVLKLSKLESQELVADREYFRLDEQIRDVLVALEPEWSQKNIALGIALTKSKCFGNRELLRQVWINLIGNAVKFTPENGKIDVLLFHDSPWIRVMISDNGIGMDEETQKHIFKKFYQGDRARNTEGNGLGLALTKRIIDLCDGRIEVESQPGKGSKFTVVLPEGEQIPENR